MRALSLGKSTSRVKNNREAIMHKPSKAALMIFSRSGTDSDQVVWVGEAVAFLCIVARRANSCPHTWKSVIMWGWAILGLFTGTVLNRFMDAVIW